MDCPQEFEFKIYDQLNLKAKSVLINGEVQIKLLFKSPKGNYYSFLNDAGEKYDEIVLYNKIKKEKMKNLKLILEKANEILGKKVFEFRPGATEPTIWNPENRFEGNDIDMTDELGVFVLKISGLTEEYVSIKEAVDALVELVEI